VEGGETVNGNAVSGNALLVRFVNCAPASARSIAFASVVVLFFPAIGFGQLPSSRCDSIESTLEDCTSLTQIAPAQNVALGGRRIIKKKNLNHGTPMAESSTPTTYAHFADSAPQAGFPLGPSFV
jgi:hypothetical protein